MTTAVQGDQVEVEGPFDAAMIRSLLARGPIRYLSFMQGPKLTRRVSTVFNATASVRQIWLWLEVTRNALNDVILTPDLEVLDLLQLSAPGQLERFDRASSLTTFRTADALSPADLVEILKAPALRELQSRGGEVDHPVVDAVLNCKTLTRLDLESSRLDDTIIEGLSRSKSLLSLEVGATKMTAVGLKSICRMTQLEHLDIWFTNIIGNDLNLLRALPSLKSLSIGGHSMGGPGALHAAALVPILKDLKSLEKLWLDGIYCSDEDEQKIRALFPDVRINRVENT